MFRRARIIRLLSVAAAATAAFATAQDSQPRAAPTLSAPAQNTQPQTQTSPITTLKANAQLVVVDVIVTDSKQQSVHDLKASDFTVHENGAPQALASFEEHVQMTPAQAAKVPPMRPLPPGIFTNYTPIPPNGPVNVLLLDALNTQMKDQLFVREQLRQFLKNTPADTRIAIFVLNDRLIMLQGFTSDLTVLKAVVDRNVPGSSMILGDSTGNHDNAGNGGTPVASDIMASVSGGDIDELTANVRRAETVQAATDTQDRALQTLSAMNQLAHFLAGIPGRKNLIWFSGSFPLTIFPDSTISHPFSVVASMEDEFRQTTSILARSQVAVYPIDARGLQFLGPAIAKESTPASSSGKGLTMAQNKLFQDNANEHATMFQMASDTGGHAYVDTNGLSDAVAKAIDGSSNYYTLSYAPTDSRQDGKFRKIQVKLARSGLTLSYRTGYYADDSATLSKRGQTAARPTPLNSLTKAMMRGAPDATEILLKLQTLPVNGSIEDKIASGNIFNTAEAAKLNVKGPFRRYAIDIAAEAKDVQITPTPDGHYKFTVEILTCVYDPLGALINTAVEKAHGNLSASTYANMRHTGLPFHQEISVPVSGQFYLRTSVHDLETDRYGSVEFPVASVAKLAPLAAAAAAPPSR
ncbi:MAG TPA: VWA domain-containing protein [Acidobacteriaceae bacterium]